MKKLILTLALSLLSLAAHAGKPGRTGKPLDIRPAFPLWGCAIEAEAENRSLAVIVGGISIQAQGQMVCETAAGQVDSRDVVINIVGVSFGPQIDLSAIFARRGSMKIALGEIGLSSVDAIYGQFRFSAGARLHLGPHQFAGYWDIASFTPRIPNGKIASGLSVRVLQNASASLGLSVSIEGMEIITPEEAAERKFREEQEWMNRQSQVH